MAKKNIEVCSEQEVSTYDLKVSTHEGTRYNFGNEMSTHDLEESTHIDSKQSKI